MTNLLIKMNIDALTNIPKHEAQLKLCSQIEEAMEDIAIECKGLVSKEAFSNIAFDMWEQVNGEGGDCYPSKGDEELF